MKNYFLVSAAALLLLATGCIKKKDNPDTGAVTGKVKLEFANKVGANALNLGNQWYRNEHGDSFKVDVFNYYISNIKLNGPTAAYTEVESYHLVQQNVAGSMVFDLANVPGGDYTSITFTIGVDSLRNVSGAQTGALDVANGMFWSWNTGYIMWKLEGTSPQADGSITFHGGGFKGEHSVLRTITLNLPKSIKVAKDGVNHIHINADVLAMFKSPNVIDFSVTKHIMSAGPDAAKLADNVRNMFSIEYAGL